MKLKDSLIIVTSLHFIVLYFILNELPLSIWNVVWTIQGLRPLPL